MNDETSVCSEGFTLRSSNELHNGVSLLEHGFQANFCMSERKENKSEPETVQ